MELGDETYLGDDAYLGYSPNEPRHLTLEPVELGIGAPAVGITIDGLDPSGQSRLRILRSTSGDAPTAVQGMSDLTATGAGYWIDYLPPLGREVTYMAEVIEGEDPGKLDNSIFLESEQAWLQDALNPVIGCPIAVRPRRNEKIWFTTEAFATLERALPAEAVQIIGARMPVMVRGRRQAPSSIPLNTITDAAEAGATLRSVLNESTHLVLRVPTSIRQVDPVLYLGDVQVTESPSRQAFLGGHLVRWEITAQQSRGPRVMAYTVLWTYDGVQELYDGMTYGSMVDARRYVDWLAHPDELGFETNSVSGFTDA